MEALLAAILVALFTAIPVCIRWDAQVNPCPPECGH